jgi:hypothetical protein
LSDPDSFPFWIASVGSFVCVLAMWSIAHLFSVRFAIGLDPKPVYPSLQRSSIGPVVALDLGGCQLETSDPNKDAMTSHTLHKTGGIWHKSSCRLRISMNALFLSLWTENC